jgi:hypothetical protein
MRCRIPGDSIYDLTGQIEEREEVSMLKRRVVMLVALALLGAFFVATAATVAIADPPGGCKSCRKTDCPKGPCYFDCESCCFLVNHVVYCYK